MKSWILFCTSVRRQRHRKIPHPTPNSTQHTSYVLFPKNLLNNQNQTKPKNKTMPLTLKIPMPKGYHGLTFGGGNPPTVTDVATDSPLAGKIPFSPGGGSSSTTTVLVVQQILLGDGTEISGMTDPKEITTLLERYSNQEGRILVLKSLPSSSVGGGKKKKKKKKKMKKNVVELPAATATNSSRHRPNSAPANIVNNNNSSSSSNNNNNATTLPSSSSGGGGGGATTAASSITSNRPNSSAPPANIINGNNNTIGVKLSDDGQNYTAVICHLGRTAGTVTTEHFQYVVTTPTELPYLILYGDRLNAFVKAHIEPNAVGAFLYDIRAWSIRGECLEEGRRKYQLVGRAGVVLTIVGIVMFLVFVLNIVNGNTGGNDKGIPWGILCVSIILLFPGLWIWTQNLYESPRLHSEETWNRMYQKIGGNNDDRKPPNNNAEISKYSFQIVGSP